MNRSEFQALDQRVEDQARDLRAAAGSPAGGHARFSDQARELVALSEVDLPTLDVAQAAMPVVEEAAIQSNLGEFPTLRDEGDENHLSGCRARGRSLRRRRYPAFGR